MKELRVEGESGSGSLATEKIQNLVREHHHHLQNRDLHLHQHHQNQHQHNLVSSGLPSPTQYLNQGISSLLNTQALSVFGADPAMLSAHLLASIAASNAAGGGRFQIPLSIPLGPIPVSNPQLFPHHHHLHHHVQAGNVDILSNWVKEQQAASKKVDQDQHHRRSTKITSSGLINKTPMKMKNNAKDPSNWSVSKANKRNKNGHNINNNNNDNITNNNHHQNHHHKNSVTSVKVEGSMGDFRHELDVVNEDDHIPIKKEKNNSNSRNGGSERDKVIQKNVQNANNNKNNINNNSSSMIIESNNIEQQLQPQSNRDKVFICPICNRCFGYKHVLQNHERTHTGEKPFECTICHKKFTRDHHLKTHMRLHTGEKPYQCTHCERQFVQVANLRRHLRVHTGERPYACELCSSRFSDSNQLKAHNLIHKGEKPYSCDDCGGRFRRRHHLAHHKCKDNLTIVSSSASTGGSPPFHSDGKETISPPSSREKHERKPRETRRILRFGSTPVSSAVSHSPVHSPAHSGGSGGSGGINIGSGGLNFIHGLVPEQTVPEDLSLSGGNVISRNSNFSGSCSASGSPSPHSGGSNSSSLGGDFY